jgi:Uma2 family endonuclease
MAVQTRIEKMTVDEYDALMAREENSDRHLELVDGELIEEMPTPRHSKTSQYFSLHIGMYLLQNPTGDLLPEVRIKLLEGTEFEAHVPDMAFVKSGRTYDPDSPLPFMPELIIEIQSPGQSKRVMAKKADYYIRHGCKIVVLAYPVERLIEMVTPLDRFFLQAGDTLDLGAVLPGFTLAVDVIFPPAREQGA